MAKFNRMAYTISTTILLPIALFIASTAINTNTIGKKSLAFSTRFEGSASQLSSMRHFSDITKYQFENNIIPDPYVSMSLIYNNGDTPVTPRDYSSDIVIPFKTDGNIIHAEFLYIDDFVERPTLKIKGNSVLVSPVLLNPGESITLRIIATKEIIAEKIKSRIAGIHSIKDTTPRNLETISLEHVRYLSAGQTNQSRIFSFSQKFIISAIIIFWISSFLLYYVGEKIQTPLQWVLIPPLAASYASGAGFCLLINYNREFNAVDVRHSDLTLVVYGLSFICAMLLLLLYRRKRNKNSDRQSE